MWWRSHPRVASVLALGLFLAALAIGGGWFPDTGVALFSVSFAVLALGWSGRAAWLVAVCALAYLVPFYYLSGEGSWVAALMFTVPPYAAGTVLRLRRETADQLALRAQELEEERELFAEIALRHERARIASELHDIVGHAISVMVIQAAAGQRLVDADPARAKEAFAAISESARQGTKDLERLIELLGGSAERGRRWTRPRRSSTRWSPAPAAAGSTSPAASRATATGSPQPVAHLAFRVVQESLTNALRYAPGAEVRIVISVDEAERGLAVRVENDRAAPRDAALVGTGRGLVGLRERVQTLGGQFSAGRPASAGGRSKRASPEADSALAVHPVDRDHRSMETVTTRRARASDAAALAEIATAAYSPYLERMGGQRPAPLDADYAASIARHVVWVAEVGVHVAGLLVLVDEPAVTLLENVAVHPDWQGRGIGGLLMSIAEDHARSTSADAVRLYTHASMVENRRLYEHLGYTQVGQGVDDGLDRVFYEKRLARLSE